MAKGSSRFAQIFPLVSVIFAVTSDPFLVYTSNVFAILGLRSLYFLLAGVVHRFVYLKYGLAAVLVFVGTKMMLVDVYKVPVVWSLAVITGLIGSAIAASLVRSRGPEQPVLPEGEHDKAA